MCTAGTAGQGDASAVQICCSTSVSLAELIQASQFPAPHSLPTASPCCGNVLWCTERAQLPKKKVHAENLNLVYMKPSAFKLLAVSPQVEEAIWFPCILSRKNFRYHLFFRGLKLTCVYLKTSACLANTNMQLWFSGTHYLTSWYVPRG